MAARPRATATLLHGASHASIERTASLLVVLVAAARKDIMAGAAGTDLGRGAVVDARARPQVVVLAPLQVARRVQVLLVLMVTTRC